MSFLFQYGGYKLHPSHRKYERKIFAGMYSTDQCAEFTSAFIRFLLLLHLAELCTWMREEMPVDMYCVQLI